MNAVGIDEEDRAVDVREVAGTGPVGLMSATIAVPRAVPLLSHNSRPCRPSFAKKKSVPLTFVRSKGSEPLPARR